MGNMKGEKKKGGGSLPTNYDCRFMVQPQPLFIISPLIDHLATSPLELPSDVSGDLKIPSSTRGWAAPRIALADAPGPLKSAHCLHEASVFDDRAVYAARLGAFFPLFTLSASEGCLSGRGAAPAPGLDQPDPSEGGSWEWRTMGARGGGEHCWQSDLGSLKRPCGR